jgi:hypothetical protein
MGHPIICVCDEGGPPAHPGDTLKPFVDALSSIKGDPLTLVAYVICVAAWVVVSLQSRKASKLFKTVRNLPEKDRLAAISLEYRTSPRAGLSAEQWIRSRKHLYLFSGFAITVLVLFALIISAEVYAHDHPSKQPCSSSGTNTTEGDHSPIIPCNEGTINSTDSSAARPQKPSEQPKRNK